MLILRVKCSGYDNQYSLGKKTPAQFLSERIITEIDQAMTTLHEKVKKAETEIKSAYADIVK